MSSKLPGFAHSLTKIVEGIAMAFGGMLSGSFPDFCSLETADSEFTLVTAEGRLLSGFELDGLTGVVGVEEFESVVSRLATSLRPFLKDKSHTIQFFASVDKDGVSKELRSASQGSRNTLKTLNLKLEDVLDSREENLSNYCANETLYLAIWTHPGALPIDQLKTELEKKKAAGMKLPSGSLKGGGQDLLTTLGALREVHESLVKTLNAALGENNAGFSLKQLTCHQMLRSARKSMDPGFTPDGWKACLPGDKVPGAFRGSDEQRKLTIADVQYPPINWQLFPREAKKIDNKYLEMGDKIFAPVFIEIAPQDIEPFSGLFEKLHTVDVPWSTSFTIDGGGMEYVGVKAGIASFLVWASPYNGKIRESVEAMKVHARDSGATYTRLKIAFCTWAPIGKNALLRSRVSKLVHAISSWGDCEVREVTGDPLAGVLSTIPFLSHESIANPSVAPLSHVMRMLPIMRQASPWRHGSVLYRTRDGKLIPFEPGSALQDTWNYILFAPPGSGKSVQLASILLAAATQPGLKDIPRIGIVDIGPSSRGLIRLLQDGLPRDQRHKVAYIKLRNTSDFAINIFDTFPGCRFPTPEHRAFLVNVLSQIATPAERSESYSSISEIASQVIDDLYHKKSDATRATPNVYERGQDPVVDKALDAIGFTPNRTTSWWSAVDKLFAASYVHESTLAQRHAVPNLSDVPGAAQEQTIKDQFSAPTVETMESLNSAFARLITSGMRMYPILSSKTKFDLGEVRIAALNIEEVAKSGSAADIKQTALMYMIANAILTKDFKIDKEFACSEIVPPMYRDHLVNRAIDSKENMKWIVFDEFHRTSNSPAVQTEVLVSMREGRKWNLGVILASQSLDDFPAAFKEFATAVFILKAANNLVADKLQALFGLSDTTKALIIKRCNGPDPKIGAAMMVHFTLKSGQTDMLLYSTLGPYELWALSTTPEDAALMERVSDGLCSIDPENGSARARMALSKMYPGGVKAKIAEMKRLMQGDSDEAEGSAIQELARQVLEKIAS